VRKDKITRLHSNRFYRSKNLSHSVVYFPVVLVVSRCFENKMRFLSFLSFFFKFELSFGKATVVMPVFLSVLQA